MGNVKDMICIQTKTFDDSNRSCVAFIKKTERTPLRVIILFVYAPGSWPRGPLSSSCAALSLARAIAGGAGCGAASNSEHDTRAASTAPSAAQTSCDTLPHDANNAVCNVQIHMIHMVEKIY